MLRTPMDIVGAAPLHHDDAQFVLVGCGCGLSFEATCSVVVSGAGHRERVDLTAEQAAAIVGVLEGQEAPVVYMHREGADCILVAGELRILLRGDDLQGNLSKALRKRRGQLPIAGEVACA
jgi:hypothetical protein